MARQTVKTTTTKKRTRKTGGKSSYRKCPRCGGSGRIRK